MGPPLHRLGLWIVAVLVAAGIFGVALVALLHSPPGERWLAGKLEEAAGQTVEFDDLRILWPFTVTADYLRLADRDGTWLTATGPVLAWRPTRLLRRVLDIDRLQAERIDVARLPRGDESAEPAAPFEWPDLAVNLGALSAPIVLAPAVVGERIELDLAGTFQMRPGGGLVDVHLRSGGGLARLAGTAGRDYVDLRWYLRLPRLDRWSRLAGLPVSGELTGSGLVAGRLPQPVVSGTVETGRARVGGLRWDALSLSARVIPEDEWWRLALSAEGRALGLDGGPAPLPVVTVSAAGDIAMDGRLRLGMARLAGDGVSLALSGVVAEWGRRADLRVEAGFDDLGDHVPVSGRASARATLSGDLLAPDLRGDLRAQGSKFASGIAVLDRLLGEHPRAATRFHVRPDLTVTLDGGSVSGARARAVVDGTVAGRLALWTRVEVPDVGALAEGIIGGATVSARIGGSLTAPSVVGVARLRGVAPPGAPPAEGGVSYDLALPRGGTVAADLTIAGRPLDGSARLVLGKPLQVRDLLLHSRGARVAGDLAIAPGGVRGRLTGRIPELKEWRELLGHPVTGSVEAEAILDPADGQSARLELRATGLAAEGVAVGRATLGADLAGLTARPRGRARLEAGGVAAGGQVLDRLDLDAEGDAGSFRLEAAGNGPLAAITAAGRVRLRGGGGEAALDALRVERQHRAVVLVEPTRVEWGGGRVGLSPAAFAIDGGRVTVAGSLDGKALSGRATLADLPLEVVALVAPELDAVGMIDGGAEFGGTLEKPTARFQLTGRRVGLAAAARAGVGRMNAELSGEWRDDALSARLAARDGDRVRLEAAGSLRGDAMDGTITVEGDLARLTEALPLAGHAFAGKLAGEAAIVGTLAAPRIDGGARLTGGRYENFEQGTVITDLAARVDFDGGRAAFEASGRDGGRGRVSLTGDASLGGPWRGELRLDRFTAVRRDDVEAIATGRLDLAGNGAEGRVGGRLAIPRAEVDIGRLRGGGPVTIEVVEINRPGQSVAEQGDAPPDEAVDPPLTLALDVAVAVEHAFVRGRGLDSEWQGDLAVAGTADDPRLTGQLVAARGDYRFLGKSFRLQPDSTVRFDGGDPGDPALDVTATARATDITARVEVTGTGRSPELTMASDPPLPEDEVLARVLFGTGVGSLSAYQQIQLAQMAAGGLTGDEGGFDPIGSVRGLLGLDVLDVGGESATGPTLSAGKYVGSDTFVRVEQGTQGLGAVTVERELGGGFSVETEIGQQSGGGVGLSWRKNY